MFPCWYNSSRVPWCNDPFFVLSLISLIPWHDGTMFHVSVVYLFQFYVVPWLYGFMIPWDHGFLTPWFQVLPYFPWFHVSMVRWFTCSLVARFPSSLVDPPTWTCVMNDEAWWLYKWFVKTRGEVTAGQTSIIRGEGGSSLNYIREKVTRPHPPHTTPPHPTIISLPPFTFIAYFPPSLPSQICSRLVFRVLLYQSFSAASFIFILLLLQAFNTVIRALYCTVLAVLHISFCLF